jgi:hypothetical protein
VGDGAVITNRVADLHTIDDPTGEIFYRFHATNAGGHALEHVADSEWFIATNLWTESSDAHEVGTPGTVTVCRAVSATSRTVAVDYTVGGTATPGADYAALSGRVTLPAGSDRAVIEIDPVFDYLSEDPDESVVVSLQSGALYPVADGHLETVLIREVETMLSEANTFFDPDAVPSLGRLELDSGTLTFDTGGAGREPTVSGAFEGTGSVGASMNTNVQLAVFAFDRIDLGSAVAVTVTGDRGLMLLSRRHAAIDTTIDVSGAPNTRSAGGLGGPGAEGGTAEMEDGADDGDGTYESAPPPDDRGAGGLSETYTYPSGDGTGYGGGQGANADKTSGGGGGYGGWGGERVSTPNDGDGGKPYGSADLAILYGGSGGGGTTHRDASAGIGAGGGGGVLAIVAEGTVTLGAHAVLRADGGSATNTAGVSLAQAQRVGGGGSGGAILLAAESIVTNAGCIVSANGGASVNTGSSWGLIGGRGSGGRIAFYSEEDFSGDGQSQAEAPPAGVHVSPGAGGLTNQDAGDGSGTFYDGERLRFLRLSRGAVLIVW